MNEQIVILDFGSQYTQVIARRIRECSVYSTILRYDTPASEIAKLNPKGIILSGGPSSVYAPDAPLPDKAIFKLDVPILGICYGVQLLAHYLGGRVEKGQKREYGKGTLTIADSGCALFAGLPKTLQVWNSHGDKLTRFPKDFVVVGTTDNSDYAAIEHPKRRIFGIQFHPEVVHTPDGAKLIGNFVRKVAGLKGDWTMRAFREEAIDKIVAIISPETAVAKRLRDMGRESNNLIDCTMGRKLRSMVLTDSDFIFLSAMRPEALMQRMERPGTAEEAVED